MASKELPTHYMFVDLETTGLDPNQGYIIIEAVFIFTDAQFNELDSRAYVIGLAESVWNTTVDTFVDNMHTKNGLKGEALNSPVSELKVISNVHSWLDRLEKAHDVSMKKVPLAGSTIGFDRAWLKFHWPKMESRFHYRSFDVSTLKMFFREIWPAAMAEQPADSEEHRAFPDIKHSIKWARFIRQMCSSLHC